LGNINLYKIDEQKQIDFVAYLEKKYDLIGNQHTLNKVVNKRELSFNLSFYLNDSCQDKPVEWNWILEHFEYNRISTRSNPRGILLIKEGSEMFACTFGFSYFIADKYCDTDFAFEFARRIEYKEIKTATLLSPSSKRNKAVNTYLNYSSLEFDSGESFAKIKVKADLPKDFELFTSNIEIGHSIKFNTLQDSVDSIINILTFVRQSMLRDEIYKIPVYNKVTNKDEIKKLDQHFSNDIEENPLLINLSELDIVGATEIFNNRDSYFDIKYRRKRKTTPHITEDIITAFIEEQGLTLFEGLDKVKIVSYGEHVHTERLYNLIDYVDDKARCLLSKGVWYYFNDDYLEYLKDSLEDIEVAYDPGYDFSTKIHNDFLKRKYLKESNYPDYLGKSKDEIQKKLKDKYYKEYAYNLLMEEHYKFECLDRFLIQINRSKVELADLYKDETLFSVKIGNASSTLCYAVDQSLTAAKLYKHELKNDLPKVEKMAIWFILDRRLPLKTCNGKPNINKLEMLSLKNKLDNWKKEIRLLGYTPLIRINYFNLSC